MKKQITIYLTLTLLVFGLGYIVFTLFAKDGPEPPPAEPAHEAESTIKDEEPEPPAQSLLVKMVNGVVERSGVAEESWAKVVPGDELYADEKLRTDKDANVKLQADDSSKIELDGQTEISIQEINDTVHRIKLELGRLNVDYRTSEKRRLKISGDPEYGEAETQNGRFVIQKGNGVLSVATEEGEVELSADNTSVTVGPGKLSYVFDGKSPSQPKPIPLKVMLRVANPSKLRQAEKVTTIKGRTEAGAIVTVNDTLAPVDPNGHFQVAIPLENGRNPIEVVAQTAHGSAEKQLPGVLVTPAAGARSRTSVDSARVRWGTKKKKKNK